MSGDGSTPETSAARSARWLRTLVIGVLVAAPLAACSVLLDTTKPQCRVDGDCDARGGAFVGATCVASFCQAPGAAQEASVTDAGGALDAGADVDPILGCVGELPVPTPKTPTVKLDILLHDFLQQGKPVTQVQARVCPSPNDPLCSAGTAPITPGADGHVKFELDVSKGAFSGYIAVDPTTPDAGSDAAAPEAYMPTRIAYTNQPIAADLTDDWLMATPSTLSTFTSLYNLQPLDPKLGFVILVVKSCKDVELAGAVVAPDLTGSTSLGFYFVDGTPSVTAKVTDSTGYFGFLNSPTGARTFTASYKNKHLGTLTTFAYPNTITVGPLGPDPKP